MRISDWSSDVCSSDLQQQRANRPQDRKKLHLPGVTPGAFALTLAERDTQHTAKQRGDAPVEQEFDDDAWSGPEFYRTPERKPEQAEHVKAQLKGHGPARHDNLPLVLAGGRLPAAAQDQLAPTIFQAWCRHGFSIGRSEEHTSEL